jgi:hypothetical protein
MSKRTVRILLGVVILCVSCALLVWGLVPFFHDTSILFISPENMQLP